MSINNVSILGACLNCRSPVECRGAGKMGFGGLDALTAAKDLYPKDKPGYPTPNIAVSGNNVVIAWATGVVTVESISTDGTIHRTILGPPSDKNIP